MRQCNYQLPVPVCRPISPPYKFWHSTPLVNVRIRIRIQSDSNPGPNMQHAHPLPKQTLSGKILTDNLYVAPPCITAVIQNYNVIQCYSKIWGYSVIQYYLISTTAMRQYGSTLYLHYCIIALVRIVIQCFPLYYAQPFVACTQAI